MDGILFLGGSACAGKSSVARLLAARHRLTLYSVDERFAEHRPRAESKRHLGFIRLMDRKPQDLFAGSAESQAAELLAFYRDELEMVLEDLEGISGPAVAEGVGLLPELVAPHLGDRRTAVFLVATADFRRRTYRGRGAFVAELLAQCADPDAAFERWMARDDLVAERIVETAGKGHLPTLLVDGSKSVESVTAAVEHALGWPANSPASASPPPAPACRTNSTSCS